MEADLVLRGVTVVDPRDGGLAADRDVAIQRGRIVAVSPRTGDVPAGDAPTGSARVIDATGRFLVPGFNDMHAHMHSRPIGEGDSTGHLELMLAHGVTGFRQMSGSAPMLARRAAGTLLPDLAPRLHALPGPILSPLNASTGAAAVTAVRQQHEQGADFIKAALVTPEVFYAAQAEAVRLGIPILGHLPAGIDVARASGSGVRSIEHLGPGTSLLSCCATDPDSAGGEMAASTGPKLPPLAGSLLAPILARVMAKVIINPTNMLKAADVELLERAARGFDDDAAARLAHRFVADATWQVPTLVRSRATQVCDDPAYARDANLRYIAPDQRRAWTKAAARFARFPEPTRQTLRIVYTALQHLTRLFDSAGVDLLTGSDSGGGVWEVPGIALHQEFDQLAAAGLSPLSVLRMTTWNPARFLDRTDEMGTVEPGKDADLVLLDANPIESVHHLHQIAGVVCGGRYLGPGDLEALKASAISRVR
jgi:imidazolonepropionase-like amidohydrolase